MTEKNLVFEKIFFERWDKSDKRLTEAMVELEVVSKAIRALRADGKISLSDKNPANFIKDYLRSPRRNENWPESIRKAGYTARQRTGAGQCFEFVALPKGEEPFPDDFLPTGEELEHVAQTLSLPIATREILRVDEPSLAQLAVKLFLVEQLFATSPTAVQWGLQEVEHLQNNVKLRYTDIDAVYQAIMHTSQGLEVGAITVEVKIGDPIISEQIEQQALAVLSDEAFQFCIPTILKRFSKGEIIALHLGVIRRSDITEDGKIVLGERVHSLKFRFQPELPKI
ncbi:hypothetical protein [Hyphococcus sp.]|uniref:hypothetical protein n=1 Tax=Hyphococcus sp. TaxID=2038636 RepID=UPI003CCBEE9D